MPRVHAQQKKPAALRPSTGANALASPRGFGPVDGRRKAPAPPLADGAAPPGHDFARVAVRAPTEAAPVQRRRNHTGIPDALKAGIERLSGLPMDDVRVHLNSPKPAKVQAAAYTQGTHIHVAPGQERHLPHEAWHVVQQKQGRVRATGRVAGLPLNDAEHLESEASVMGTKAAAPAPTPAAPASAGARGAPAPVAGPVQRWPEWLDNLLGKKKSHYPEGLPEHQRGLYDATQSAHQMEHDERRSHERWARDYDPERAQRTVASPVSQDVQQVGSLGSGALAGVAKVGESVSALGMGASTGPALGAAGAALSVPASLLSAYHATSTAVTGQDKKKDKALLGAQALSDLGSAATTTASGLVQGSKALGASSTVGSALGSAATMATKIAAPVAIAKGGVDIVRGGVQAGLAGYRRKKLAALEERGGNMEGAARFGKQTQTTRMVRGVGTAVGGALALGGGVALLASNPIGWGLLGGAAVIGGGMAVYKRYREHQLGKKMANDPDYQRQLRASGVHVPDSQDLAPRSRWESVKNFFTGKTENVRRYHMVRAHLAESLAKREKPSSGYDFDVHAPRVVSSLGLKPPPGEAHDEEERLIDPQRDERREKAHRERVKNIARALEG
jgi:hypothetical protein